MVSATMPPVLFDDALGLLVETVAAKLGHGAFERGVVLRDAAGLLSFVCAETASAETAGLADTLKERLQAYGRPDRVLVFADEPGAQRLLDDPDRVGLWVGDVFCWVIDRRIVGAGWLGAPESRVASPPRVVFASLKGGVGRTTALAVTAWDLASRGQNILVIDLDLEAPGLGEVLLAPDRIPRLGVVDYLVEAKVGGITEDVLDACVGVSELTSGSGGRVDVVPAFGTRSVEAPENVLPKLARAMIEAVGAEGEVQPVGAQISEMIRRLAARETYDVILIDARAGLAELTAPAVLGLGALVLLFGTAQQQTIAGYKALFAAFKLLALRDAANGQASDWRLMFKPVYAKASLDQKIAARHKDDLYELFADNLYNPSSDDDSSNNVVNFAVDDAEAPHAPFIIPFAQHFVDFDPVRNSGNLEKPFYELTFRPFLDGLDRALQALHDIAERKSP